MISSSSSEIVGGLADAFATRRARGDATLVVYVTSGYPDPDRFLDTLISIADAGADVIELGVPFSDPLADGPTIQKSSARAIASGVDLEWTLSTLAAFRERRPTPTVVFSYLNPIYHYGVERFMAESVDAGASGVLITDLPVGADPAMEDALQRSSLDLVRLVAPTTTDRRLREILAGAGGFIYYVSRTGVTGTQEAVAEGIEAEVLRVKAATDLPVAVGFGISSAAQAATVGRIADGVIVGSAVVEALGKGGGAEAAALVSDMREALNGVRG